MATATACGGQAGACRDVGVGVGSRGEEVRCVVCVGVWAGE
jgi:hypothetical protein